MQYPTIRYGNPAEFEYHARGIPLKVVAKMLRRSERSVRDWLSGNQKMPWWVPEVLRLRNIEWAEHRRQSGLKEPCLHLGMRGNLVYFPLKSVRAWQPVEFALQAASLSVSPPKMRQAKKKAQLVEEVDLNQWRRWKVA
jgi:hypothetical protein